MARGFKQRYVRNGQVAYLRGMNTQTGVRHARGASAGVEPATFADTTGHTGQVCGLAGVTSTKDPLLCDIRVGARPTRACPSHTATIHARERGMRALIC